MSFPDFDEPAPTDPTADFLARERAALGGDAELFGSAPSGTGEDKDFEHSASAFPDLDGAGGESGGFGSNDAPPAPAATSGGFGFDDDEPLSSSNAAPPQVSVSGEGDVGAFERDYPALEEPEQPAPSTTNGFIPAPEPSQAARSPQPTSPYGGPSTLNDGEEPEPVRAWREKQHNEISRRDAEAERRKQETIVKAEHDIDNFYTEYNAKKEKAIAANKEAEARFHDERTRELAEGTTWSRVSKILELQNSQSKTIARSGPGSTDLGRMKEVYLSLRREGETAPGAAGY